MERKATTTVALDFGRITIRDCFPSVDYFEQRGLPFIIAVNSFDGARRYRGEDVRSALDLEPGVPVLMCDARRPSSGRDALVALVTRALDLLGGQGRPPGGPPTSLRAWQIRLSRHPRGAPPGRCATGCCWGWLWEPPA